MSDLRRHLFGGAYQMVKMGARTEMKALRRAMDALSRMENKGIPNQAAHALRSQEAQKILQSGRLTAGRDLPFGSQIKRLGSGGEGVASKVVMPGGDVKVMKTIDPTSLGYSDRMERNRQSLVGQDIPGFAKSERKLLAPNKMQGRDVPVYQNEYIQGKTLPMNYEQNPALKSKVDAIKARGAAGVGNLELADLNRSNFKVTPQGDVKVIDTMPVEKGHMLPQSQRGRDNVIHENINPGSPTYQEMNAMNKDHVALSNRVLRPEDQATVLAALKHPNKRVQSWAQNELNRSDRFYAGQLQRAAMGKGGDPQSYILRPAPQVPGAPTPAPVARQAVTNKLLDQHLYTPQSPAMAPRHESQPGFDSTVAQGPVKAPPSTLPTVAPPRRAPPQPAQAAPSMAPTVRPGAAGAPAQYQFPGPARLPSF